MSELNIYQRLNEVRKKLPYLQKDKKVESYKAVTHDWVTANVRPLFIEFGIIVVPVEIESRIDGTGKQTSKQTPITRFVAKYEIFFINIDEPKDQAKAVITAAAEDTSDKGPGKAISYAVKYAFLKILNIETGESEESRIDSEPALVTGEQVDMIRETLMNYELHDDVEYNAKLKSYLKVKDYDDLPAKRFKEAMSAINVAGKARAGK